MVEHQPSKLRVAGSSPVARLRKSERRKGGMAEGVRQESVHVPPVRLTARDAARVAQLVERILGKDEVSGSIPLASLRETERRKDGKTERRLMTGDDLPSFRPSVLPS